MDNSLRYFGSAVGFGFAAVWMTVGLGSAILCVLLAAFGYAAIFVAERAQANGSMPRFQNGTPRAEAPPLSADELDREQYEQYEPAEDAATAPLAAEAEYGWPWPVENSEKSPASRP